MWITKMFERLGWFTSVPSQEFLMLSESVEHSESRSKKRYSDLEDEINRLRMYFLQLIKDSKVEDERRMEKFIDGFKVKALTEIKKKPSAKSFLKKKISKK